MTGRTRPAAVDAGPLLEAAAAISRRFGHDRRYARAGGGNSSVKSAGVLYIKPSGVSLGGLSATDLVALDEAPLLELLERGPSAAAPPGSDIVMSVAMAARLRQLDDRRPSVECLFHALIRKRFVLHTHPTAVNALTCARDGERLAERLFGEAALWVPYVDPGLPLAREIAERRRRFEARTARPAPEVTLLGNHGLIVAADEIEDVAHLAIEAVEVVERAIATATEAPGMGSAYERVSDVARAEIVPVARRALAEAVARDSGPAVVVFDASDDAVALATRPAGRRLVEGGPLTPDQIVYAGSWPLWLELPSSFDEAVVDTAVRDAVAGHLAAHGEPPTIVVAAGLGIFAAAEAASAAATASEIYLDATRVGFGALRLGGVRALDEAERSFIEHWEAEAYRRRIAAGRADLGGAGGEIAIGTEA
jgi:rhamnulokinase